MSITTETFGRVLVAHTPDELDDELDMIDAVTSFLSER